MARKLAISPSEIIQFLAAQNIFVVDNANTRLEDNQVELLQKKFAPFTDFNPQSVISAPQPPVAIVEPVSAPDLSESVDVITTPVNSVETPEREEEKDLIKAPKIALSGLKVLGKIELPEPKKREEEAVLKNEGPSEKAVNPLPGERRNPNASKRPAQQARQYKNPIALKRERETEEELERNKQKAAFDKERKTQSYLKKVKLSPPTKSVRMVEEQVIQMTEADLKEEPTSLWGRFVKWIST